MKKIRWTKRKILQAAYWGIFALMCLIAVVVFRQKGIWFDDYFGSEFYKLESTTQEEQVFRAEDCVVTQKGFFPKDDTVFVSVEKADSEPIQWTLTRDGDNRLTADNGEITYTGEYQIGNFTCHFYFDDWDDYMDKWDYTGDTVGVTQRFASEGTLEGFIRMAYGQTDTFGKYRLELVFPWILLIVMAYVLGFHADVLFEWRKMWEFDYRNADALEASDFYYVSSYITAAGIWLTGILLYLHIIGLIG